MAQDKKVAVFDPAGSVPKSAKDMVREEISSVIVNTADYIVLERTLIDKVLEENKFQLGGLVDDSQVGELGRMMGANFVLVTSLSIMENGNYYISCKMTDVLTSRIDKQKTAQTQRGTSDLINVIQIMVKEMFGSAQNISGDLTTKKPTSQFGNKEIETFNGNKFGWDATKAKGGDAKIKNGYYELISNTKAITIAGVTAYGNLPVNINGKFKVSFKFQPIKWGNTSLLAIWLNSGTIRFGVGANDWAAIHNTSVVGCQGLQKTLKGNIVTISIVKEGSNWYYYYNDDLMCTLKQEQEARSDIIFNVTGSTQVNILEVVVEY